MPFTALFFFTASFIVVVIMHYLCLSHLHLLFLPYPCLTIIILTIITPFTCLLLSSSSVSFTLVIMMLCLSLNLTVVAIFRLIKNTTTLSHHFSTSYCSLDCVLLFTASFILVVIMLCLCLSLYLTVLTFFRSIRNIITLSHYFSTSYYPLHCVVFFLYKLVHLLFYYDLSV